MDRVTLFHVLSCILGILRADVDIEVFILDIALHIVIEDHHAGDFFLSMVDHHLVAGIDTGADAAGFGYL